MYVCICNAVTDREIRGAVDLGCSSFGELQRDLGVGTCCGKCEPEARRLLGHCAQCTRGGCAD